ncbi:hypothetical protein ACW9KT_21795 [Hymenobacter sp. HD11105]
MLKLLQVVGGKSWRIGWRLGLSLLAFYACDFVLESLQRLRGPYTTPTPWKISLALCFFTFLLLATGLALAFQLSRRSRHRAFLAAAVLLYTATVLVVFGGFSGPVDRPYRLLYSLACGLTGLATPWIVEGLRSRVAPAATRTNHPYSS